MDAPEHFDYVVVGVGSGGVASARRAAMYGKRVALVRRGPKTSEGTSESYEDAFVDVRYIPKKLMYIASAHVQSAKEASGYGVHVEKPTVEWLSLVARRDEYIARLKEVYARSLHSARVELVIGVAQFSGACCILPCRKNFSDAAS